MTKEDSLRKLIREEVKAAFQEELASILKEALMERKATKPLAEQATPKKTTVPGTLNTKPARPVTNFNLGANNPLNSLLTETAQSMMTDDYDSLSFDTSNMGMFGDMPQRETAVVDSVTDMMATARASSNLEAIQINAVPDFSNLMNAMKANGQI